MTRPLIILLAILSISFGYAQKIEVVSGEVEALSNVNRYAVAFDYDSNLKIQKFDSETSFLDVKAKKLEKKEAGSGERFKRNWHQYRTDIYEPSFIQNFNDFRIDDVQVTAAKMIKDTDYSMSIKTLSINPGYNDLFYVDEAEIDFLVVIYETDSPENEVYSIKTTVRGEAKSNEFERLRTVYGNLGNALSKHLNRKALLKN